MRLDHFELEQHVLAKPTVVHRAGEQLSLPPARDAFVATYPKHRLGCQCLRCLEEAKMTVMGPTRAQIIGVLPKEVTCYIRHADGIACMCTAPQIVNPGMMEACTGAAHYVLSVIKTDAKPRSGLTRVDLDFLAWSTAKMCAHWGRRALGQEELI